MASGDPIGQRSSILPLVLNDRVNSKISVAMLIARALAIFGVFFFMILSSFYLLMGSVE